MKKLDPGDADSPALFGLSAPYWLDLKGYDAAAEAKKLTMSYTGIQGDRDFQVIPKEFDAWKTGLAGRRDAVFKDFPNLNHYLIAGEGKAPSRNIASPADTSPRK